MIPSAKVRTSLEVSKLLNGAKSAICHERSRPCKLDFSHKYEFGSLSGSW